MTQFFTNINDVFIHISTVFWLHISGTVLFLIDLSGFWSAGDYKPTTVATGLSQNHKIMIY